MIAPVTETRTLGAAGQSIRSQPPDESGKHMAKLPKTWSLALPPAGVLIAPQLLSLACDALEERSETGLLQDRSKPADRRMAIAHAYARAVDWTAFDWFWQESALEWYRHERIPPSAVGAGSTKVPSAAVKRAVAHRDNWHCRYCQLPLIAPSVMTELEKRLPAALPASTKDFDSHRAACVLRLTWDHVGPRSQGGSNEEDDLVSSCGACNYQKGDKSLAELGLEDPRSRPPVQTGWTGLDGRLGRKPL